MKLYRGLEVFDFAPDFDSPEAAQLDDFTFESRGYGVATPWKTTARARRTAKFPFVLNGRNAIGEFRRFIERHGMRQKPFWFPSHTNDFPLRTDAVAGATEIVCAGHEFSTRYEIGLQHRFIALSTPDEKLECYGVAAVNQSGNNDVLTLSRGLDSDLFAEETICCPLLLVRAADDALSFDYRSGNVVSTDAAFIELPAEYPNPDEESSALDSAHFGSRPVFLYRIRNESVTLGYADFGCDLSAAGETWQAADIQHGALQSASDMLGDAVDVTLRTAEQDHPLRAYLNEFDLSLFTLDIYDADIDRLNQLDLNAPVHTGRIETVEFEKEGEIRLHVSSIFRLGEREIPTLRMQRTCNWRTYDGIGCHAVAADFTTTGVVSALSAKPPYLEAAEFGVKASSRNDPNWFALGKVTIGEEVRTCTGQNGPRLYLNFPFTRAKAGDAVSALAGDDKRINTCKLKFNQLINHSGMPYLPNNNPQLDSLQQPAATGGKKG